MNQIHEEDWAEDSWACHTGKFDGIKDVTADTDAVTVQKNAQPIPKSYFSKAEEVDSQGQAN